METRARAADPEFVFIYLLFIADPKFHLHWSWRYAADDHQNYSSTSIDSLFEDHDQETEKKNERIGNGMETN